MGRKTDADRERWGGRVEINREGDRRCAQKEKKKKKEKKKDGARNAASFI